MSHPELVTWTPAHVGVETDSALTRGVAVADLLRWEHPPTQNCEIATAVDSNGFRNHFFSQLERLA